MTDLAANFNGCQRVMFSHCWHQCSKNILANITALSTKMIQPKTGLSCLSGINRIDQVPINIPTMANAARTDRKIKFNDSTTSRLPNIPTRQLMVMMTRLVPMALFMGSPANKTSEGTIINPPPIPINPVMAPVIHPCKMSR